MAATLNTTVTTAFLLDAARAAFSDLRRSDKSDRTAAVRDLLAATTDEDRTDVVLAYGSALVRRALRVAALSTKDVEVSNVFWMLRDSVDEDGWTNFDDTSDVDVVEAEVERFNKAIAENAAVLAS